MPMMTTSVKHLRSGNVMAASGTSEKSNKVQSAVILHCAGPLMIDIYEHFKWKNEDGTDMSVEDRNDPANVLKNIEEH